MPQFDEKHVKIDGATVLWDAMTKPDQNESGTKHSFKVAVPPYSPDVAILEQLANKTLHEDPAFRGTLPDKGTMPIGTIGPQEYGGMFSGWRVFTAGTYRGVPDIYVENVLSDMIQAGSLIYPGQTVDLLVHCYANNGKVKGIACGLDGFNIQASKNSPRQNFGGPTVDTASAFGGGAPAQQAPAQQAPAQQAPAQQPVQAHDFLPQTGAAPAPAQGASAPPVVYRTPDGSTWTAEQLTASGWTAEQIQTLPRA